jgi:hypothetical protein
VPNVADGSGGKSDPPVGTGRGLKHRANIAAERGRPEYPGGLVSFAELKRRNVSYGVLVKMLWEIRDIDSDANLRNKRFRGKFTAGFIAMSESGEFNTAKTRLIPASIAAAAIVLFFTGWGYWTQVGYYKQAAKQSAQFERWAKNEVRTGCPSFGPLSKAECTYQAKQAAHENKRDEYDLYAQRTSALWAGIMAIAALVGIGLSGVGVYLVWTTFRETKRSADLAKSSLDYTKMITQRQVEAIVYFSSAHYQDKPRGDFLAFGDVGIIKFSLVNFGKTIAYDVTATIDVLAPDFEGDGSKQVLAEEKFGQEFYPAGRRREYEIEFKWPEGMKNAIIGSYQAIEIEFLIAYSLDHGETEVSGIHEGTMLAFLGHDRDRVDFVPPYKGWHNND